MASAKRTLERISCRGERGQTTLEFSLVWIPVAILLFAGVALGLAMVQVTWFEQSIGQADWAADIDENLAASDPAAAVENALVDANPALARAGLTVKSAKIDTRWKEPGETFVPSTDRGDFGIAKVEKNAAVRHVQAVVEYKVAAAVPFTEITGLTRTMKIDREVIVSREFRVDASPVPAPPKPGEDGEAKPDQGGQQPDQPAGGQEETKPESGGDGGPAAEAGSGEGGADAGGAAPDGEEGAAR